MIRNQFGKRNLTLAARCKLAEELEAVYTHQGKLNQQQHGGTAPGRKKNTSAKIGESVSIDSRERAAKEAGVSHGTLAAYKAVKAGATAETMAALLTDPNAKAHPLTPAGRWVMLSLNKSGSTRRLQRRPSPDHRVSKHAMAGRNVSHAEPSATREIVSRRVARVRASRSTARKGRSAPMIRRLHDPSEAVTLSEQDFMSLASEAAGIIEELTVEQPNLHEPDLTEEQEDRLRLRHAVMLFTASAVALADPLGPELDEEVVPPMLKAFAVMRLCGCRFSEAFMAYMERLAKASGEWADPSGGDVDDGCEDKVDYDQDHPQIRRAEYVARKARRRVIRDSIEFAGPQL